MRPCSFCFPSPSSTHLNPRTGTASCTLPSKQNQFKQKIIFMREVFEGDHSLNYGADDEHYIVYPKEKTLFELCKEKNTTAEMQKEKVEDEEGKKHFSVSTYHDMIDDVSQKLKIGFEQYKKAKEEEIRKLKNELAEEKGISESAQIVNRKLLQTLDNFKMQNSQLVQMLDEDETEKQQLNHDLEATKASNTLLAQKLEEAQAENQKLSKKLDDARDEICCKDITIRRMKKDADRKAAAMVTDTSRMREDFAKEMIGSAVKFVKGLKKRINHGHEVLYTELLQQMTNGCFSEGESIRDELYKLIDEIPAYLKQIANEELRPNNVTVKEGGVYNGVVHHQNIHPKADLSDFLPEVDMKDSLPRYKRRRFRLEGEDYEWK